MTRVPLPFRVAVILTMGVLIGFGLAVGRPVKAERKLEPPPAPTSAPQAKVLPWKEARLLAQVLERVRNEYVDDVTDEQLIDAAIRGIVADLDPHSAFLEPQQFDEMRISTTGEYSGVGIQVAIENGAVKVVEPIEDTPAHRAGVLSGDTIIAVDDVAVDVENLDDTIDRMRGKAGSEVKITVARNDVVDPIEFKLARASVQVHSVKQRMLEQGVGYVRISNFSESTASDVKNALVALKKQQGAALQGLVLDLRNNPGGLLEAAVDVSDLFLESGVIVTASGRTADAKFEMDAQPGDALEGAPIMVLVNGNSASASEIVAGALQDQHRAQLVGRQTYGKGSVQTVMPLQDGKAIKLTTSRYFTPSGASIHERGITPDVVVKLEEGQKEIDRLPVLSGNPADDAELQVALDMLKQENLVRHSRLAQP